MRTLLILLSAAAVLLTSCKKENEVTTVPPVELKKPQKIADPPVSAFTVGVPADDYRLYSCTDAQVERLQDEIRTAFESAIFPGPFFAGGTAPTYTIVVDPPQFSNALLAAVEYEIESVTDTVNNEVFDRNSKKPFATKKLNTQPGSYNQVRLPLLPGTKRKMLGRARLGLTIDYPVEFAVLKLSADGQSAIVKGELNVSVNRNDGRTFSVLVKGGTSAFCFTFADGKPVARQSSSRVGGYYQWNYKTPYDTAVLVCVTKVKSIKLSLSIDLNNGEQLQLPPMPTADVRTRYQQVSRDEYKTVTPEAVAQWQVSWTKPQPAYHRFGVQIPLNTSPIRSRTTWETHFFTKHPAKVQGSGGAVFGVPIASLQYLIHSKEIADGILGVVGYVSVDVTTALETVVFEKQGDGAPPVVRTLADGTSLAVTFNKNQVKFDNTMMSTLISKSAHDKDGLELKEYFGDTEGKAYWGIPQTFSATMTLKQVRRVIPFKLLRQGTDADAFEKFCAGIAEKREILQMLLHIDRTRSRQLTTYVDDLAGLHYLVEDEARRIPLDVAQSDPKGAKRFGYEPTPANGYYFTVLKGTSRNGKAVDYKRQSRIVEFTFGEKAVNTQLALQKPVVVATPVDLDKPTFVISWGRLYENSLGNTSFEYFPARLLDTGWTQIQIVE